MDEFSAHILRQRVEALESATALSIPAAQRLFEHRITTLERGMENLQVQVRSLQNRIEFLERKKIASSIEDAHGGQSGWWTREGGEWPREGLTSTVSNSSHEDKEIDPAQASNIASPMTLLGALEPLSYTQGLNALCQSMSSAVNTNGYSRSKKQELIHEVWDGNIHWKKHGMLSDGDPFRIRYVPPPKAGDVFRTVKIEDLPANVTMSQVLGQVCYGNVYSAHLLNTVRITGYHTAIIVFLFQKEAIDFFKHAKSAGVYVNGVRVRSRIINTPTYPIPHDLRERILHWKCTRCLSMSNVTPEIRACLQDILKRSICKRYIECLQECSERGELVIRFHSVKMASQAYDLLARAPIFKGCHLRFSADPCSRIPKGAK